jgi:hypothetical protein
MATTVETRDLAPELIGVKSRVSWSAIIAGAIIALACYIVLTLLLGAVGISLNEAGVRANAVGMGILIAMIVTMIVSLFIGGWVSAQLTAGENRQEAVIYGLLTWAAVMAFAMWLVGMGVRAGYFAVVGGAVIVQNNERIPPWEEAARSAGVPEKQISDAKAAIDPQRARVAVSDPANQERARQAAMAAAWTALVATMLSMAASTAGALVGRGTTFRLFRVAHTRSQVVVPAT